MSDANVWAQLLDRIKVDIDAEEFRRWFSNSSYASDSGDQITVWVPSESMRRHLTSRYGDAISSALAQMNRHGTHVRFVVTGVEEEDED